MDGLIAGADVAAFLVERYLRRLLLRLVDYRGEGIVGDSAVVALD